MIVRDLTPCNLYAFVLWMNRYTAGTLSLFVSCHSEIVTLRQGLTIVSDLDHATNLCLDFRSHHHTAGFVLLLLCVFLCPLFYLYMVFRKNT